MNALRDGTVVASLGMVGVALLKAATTVVPSGASRPPHRAYKPRHRRRVSGNPGALSRQVRNGLEVLFPGDPRILEAFLGGSTAVVQIVPGTPQLTFPIAGGGEAIAEADRECAAAE